eukprot:6174279-Pleurochrysis_carterae.AAC.1
MGAVVEVERQGLSGPRHAVQGALASSEGSFGLRLGASWNPRGLRIDVLSLEGLRLAQPSCTPFVHGEQDRSHLPVAPARDKWYAHTSRVQGVVVACACGVAGVLASLLRGHPHGAAGGRPLRGDRAAAPRADDRAAHALR